MDTLSQKVRARFDHNQMRRVLKEKYEAKMVFTHAGGMWRAGPELLCLLNCLSDESVILDLYSNPVKVNATELFKLAQERWQEQMNAWQQELEEISRQR